MIFLYCPCDISMGYFDARSFLVATMGVIVSLVFLIFFYVLHQTFYLSRPFYLGMINFSLFSSPILSLSTSLVFPYQKSKKRVCSLIYENNHKKFVVCKTTKVNIPNILRGSQTTADFIGQQFKNLLSRKIYI